MPVNLFAKIRNLLDRSSGGAPLARRRTWSGRGPLSPAERAPGTTSRPASGRPVAIQSLEGRTMFQVGHAGVLINEQIVGTELSATAVVLTFDVPLDPVTASKVNAYGFGLTVQTSSGGNGFLDGYLGTTSSTGLQNKRVKITSAVYDPATMSVTLTAARPFRADRLFRYVHVSGTGSTAIHTATGEVIDGNGDGKPGGDSLVRFFSIKGKRISYRDVDGDIVTIKLTGPGQLDLLAAAPAALSLSSSSTGPTPRRASSPGTSAGAELGDGHAILEEVSGLGTVRDQLTSNPQFTSLLTEQ